MRSGQYFAITLLFFIFQSAPFPIVPGTDIRPDMTLVLVIHLALLSGRTGGMFFGAGAGLFHDLLLCGAVGKAMLSWGLAGFCAGALRESYLSGEFTSRMALVAAATISDALVQGAMSTMAYGTGAGHAALLALGPQVVINVLFAALAMPLLVWMDGWMARTSTRKEKKQKLQSFLAGMGATER